MRLSRLFVRFFKSFNYDYLRKAAATTEHPWERFDTSWYPHVAVDIHRSITAVVGANESGKSHLLSAVEKGISGNGIEREDFCRYSQFFSVEQGKMCWPEFGFQWSELTDTEREQIAEICDVPGAQFQRFIVMRREPSLLEIYLPDGNGYSLHQVSDEKQEALAALMPRTFRINPDVALPASVPIGWLLEAGGEPSSAQQLSSWERKDRMGLLDGFSALEPSWVSNQQTFTQNAANVFSRIAPLYKNAPAHQERDRRGFQLAADLLFKVARIDVAALVDLERALHQGKEGHVNALVEQLNRRLATSLNFPRWWAQDRDFTLRLSPRDFDLAFTIRDRTGTEYSSTFAL